MTAFNIREAIINSLPQNIKYAISVGIGLFIALIGLVNAGIVKTGMFHVGDDKLDGLIVQLGDVSQSGAIIALVGVLVTGVLLVKKVRGALLLGMLAATIAGIPLGVTKVPENFQFVSLPPSLSPIMFKLDFSQIFTKDMAIILFTFLFIDMFDTVGTLVGVASKAGFLDKDGKLPKVKQALFADAIATTCGACLGTSTVTTYVESASGVAEGGRTGLTSFTVAMLFGISLFLSPLFIMIPAAATAPALILVGLFMISPIKEIDLENFTEAIPAFLTIIMMPLTYSIAEGIVFGMLSYIFLKILTGEFRKITPVMYILGILLFCKFIF